MEINKFFFQSWDWLEPGFKFLKFAWSGGGFQNVAHWNKTYQVHCLQCSLRPPPPLCAKYAAESTYRLTGGFFSSLASLRTPSGGIRLGMAQQPQLEALPASSGRSSVNFRPNDSP